VPVPAGFRYASDTAGPHLGVEEIRALLAEWLGHRGGQAA
jgi:hypothetical protein